MIDAEKLLAPIAPDAPAGLDLRHAADDRTHRAIKELRSGGDDGDARNANWPLIRRQCEEAIGARSKDLELAGWLAEALARTEGFAGLLEGLALIRELSSRFWDEVHPQGEPDGNRVDYGARLARLNWLASEKGLLPAVRAVGFAGNSDQRREWLGWESHLEADRVGAASITNQAAYDEMTAAGAVTPEKWSTALGVTPVERLREEVATLRACLREVQEIERISGERGGAEGADLRGLTTLLGDVCEYVESRLPGASPQHESSGTPGDSARRATSIPATSGAIGSRADALARLSEVARYFRETEPHSPVSRLVERAVRWGNMSFEELLRDVVKSDSALQEIWETLGVKPPDSEAS